MRRWRPPRWQIQIARRPPAINGIARAKRIRLALRLSQQDFSDRYHIPLATISAWERHEVEPDAVAIAFLDAIAVDPDGLAKALSRPSGRPEAAA